MRAERRHELKQNALDAELHKIGGFFRTHGTRVAWIALIGALGVLAAVVWMRNVNDNKERIQTKFDEVTLAEEGGQTKPMDIIGAYRELASQTTDTRVAAMAAVRLGNYNARRAALETADAQRNALTQEAQQMYDQVLTRFSDQPLAVAQAHVGLAKLAENQGQVDKARQEYLQVQRMQEIAQTPVAREAAIGLAQLDQISEPVRFATTAPTQPTTAPATKGAKAK